MDKIYCLTGGSEKSAYARSVVIETLTGEIFGR